LPLYEYQCPKCGRFELIRKFSDEPLTKCPTCGSEIQKLMSAPAIQFKGTGWYITDYAKKGGEAKGKPEGGAADAKPADTKTETAKPAEKATPKSKGGAKS
jgi:putative FmdB family regulatory protein